jgi:hypothetical protein
LKVVGTLGTAPNAKLDIKGCGQYDAIYSGEGNKDFTISVNLVNALASSKAGDWLDLKLYYGESYTDLYKDQATNYDASFISAGRRYFFASWGPSDDAPQALKIVWEETGIIEDLAVTLEDVAGIPTLKVTGVLGSAEFAKLDIKGCGQHEATYSGANNREFTISVNLVETLAGAEEGDWLDLKLYYKNGSYNDLTTEEVTDYSASVKNGNRNYMFADWEGALKILWKELPSYTAEVGLAVVDDQVVLTVTGQINVDIDARRVHAWCGNGIDFVETSKDADGVYVYTYTFDSLATGDTMYLHMMQGSQEKNLVGTIKEGAGSVTHGGKTYTIARDGASGEITVKIA